MQETAVLLKAAMESRKQLKIDDQFYLKLPSVSSHRYHVTDGEVRCKLLKWRISTTWHQFNRYE